MPGCFDDCLMMCYVLFQLHLTTANRKEWKEHEAAEYHESYFLFISVPLDLSDSQEFLQTLSWIKVLCLCHKHADQSVGNDRDVINIS